MSSFLPKAGRVPGALAVIWIAIYFWGEDGSETGCGAYSEVRRYHDLPGRQADGHEAFRGQDGPMRKEQPLPRGRGSHPLPELRA